MYPVERVWPSVHKQVVRPGDGRTLVESDLICLEYEAYLYEGGVIGINVGALKYTTSIAGILPVGLQLGVLAMSHGEVAQILITDSSLGVVGGCGEHVPVDSQIIYKVKVSEPQMGYSRPTIKIMTNIEKLELAMKFHGEGTYKYDAKDYREAYRKYQRGMNVVKVLRTTSSPEENDMHKLLVSFLVNLGLCCNHIGHFSAAVDYGHRVLTYSPENMKAFFIIANGYFHKRQLDKAENFLRKIAALPLNEGAKDSVRMLRNKINKEMGLTD